MKWRFFSTPCADRRGPGRVLAAALVAASLLGVGPRASRASAATFTVDPTQIFLSGRTGSVLVSLNNQSTETLRFQLTVFAWGQSPEGEMQLTPTDDIVFFPSLLTLEPGETRRVRVGSATTAGPVEKTYRLFVEELPPLAPSTNGVRVLTKMGIPIFVRPVKEVATAMLEDLGLSQQDGRLRFSLANGGTVHFIPREIHVAAMTGSTTAFEQQVDGWYVLAGGRRIFNVALSDRDCAQVQSIVVNVTFGPEVLQERLQTPGGVCAR